MLFRLTVIILQLFLHFCGIHAAGTGGQAGPAAQQEGLRITLSLFSGRRNPKWSVPEKDPSYQNIVTLLGNQRGLKSLPPRLGFRGFIVKEKEKAPVNVGSNTAGLQELLLKTMPPDLIKKGNYENVSEAITGSKGTGQGKAANVKGKRYVPPYNPAPWSANDFIQRCNNCYNYANIVMTNNTAEPGSGSGQAFQSCTPGEIESAATRDGLQRLNPQPGANAPVPGDPGGRRHLVALVVDSDRNNYNGDFHWYRLDDDGKWSHKPGETEVTRLDNDNNEITDPRLASMAPYQFVSFMTSDRSTVRLQDNYQCQ